MLIAIIGIKDPVRLRVKDICLEAGINCSQFLLFHLRLSVCFVSSNDRILIRFKLPIN